MKIDKSIAERLEVNQNNGYKSTTQIAKSLKVPVGAIQTVLIKVAPKNSLSNQGDLCEKSQ